MLFSRIVTVVQVVACVLVAFTVALLFVRQPDVVASPAAPPGAAVYASSCASCHGAAGEGGTGPQLVGRVATAYPNVDDQVAVVRDGRGSMPAFAGRLSDDDLRAVVAFTRTDVGPGGSALTASIDAKAIWSAKCAGCHDDDGGGTYANGISFVGGQVATRYPDIDDQVAVVRTGKGSMSGFDGKLTDAEIRAVVEYTRTQL